MSGVLEPPDGGASLELVRRMQAGDPDAWRDLYRGYRDELLLVIRLQMGPRLRGAMDSEDMLQSVVMAALRDIPRFEPRGRGSFAAWLKRILVHRVQQHGRALAADKRSGAVRLGDTAAAGLAVPQQPTYHDDRYLALERGLLQLPEDLREVVCLRRIEGLAFREVGARMARSEDAARKLYSRAIARLTLLMREPT